MQGKLPILLVLLLCILLAIMHPVDAASRQLVCDTFSFHYYVVESTIDPVQAASNEKDLRAKTNTTQISSKVLLACDQEKVNWEYPAGKRRTGQMWRIELLNTTTVRRCPDRTDGWQGQACTKDFTYQNVWPEGTNVAYFYIDTTDGTVYWNTYDMRDVDMDSCQSLRSALIQLQQAVQGDVLARVVSPPVEGSDEPQRTVTQTSMFSDGSLQQSNRFENVYRPTQSFNVPGLSASAVSRLFLTKRMSIAPDDALLKRAQSRAAPRNAGITPVVSQEACPNARQHFASMLYHSLQCDQNLKRDVEHVLDGASAAARRIAACLSVAIDLPSIDRNKDALLDVIQSRPITVLNSPAVALLLRLLGTPRSQHVLAKVMLQHVDSEPAISRQMVFEASELPAPSVTDELVQALEKMARQERDGLLRSVAWLSLASMEHARQQQSNLPGPRSILFKDVHALRLLPIHLQVDVLNNAGAAVSIEEVRRLVYDRSLSLRQRVEAVAVVRRRPFNDASTAQFLASIMQDASLPVEVQRYAQVVRSARDPLLKGQAQQARNVHVPTWRLADANNYDYNVNTGRQQKELGSDKFGASGFIDASAGLTVRNCDGSQSSRYFAYALQGKANLEAHAFDRRFNLLDMDLNEMGSSDTKDSGQDHLRLVVLGEVWYDNRIFEGLCSPHTGELYRSKNRNIASANVYFVLGGMPFALLIDIYAQLVVSATGEVCPSRLYAGAALVPSVLMTTHGSIVAGTRGLNAGLSIEGQVTMGLLPYVNTSALACPSASACARLDAFSESQRVSIDGQCTFWGRTWSKNLYMWQRDQRDVWNLFDKCIYN